MSPDSQRSVSPDSQRSVSSHNKRPKPSRFRKRALARWVVLAVFTLTAAGILLTNASAPAKPLTAPARQEASLSQLPTGMIDGSKTPDLIQDSTAYRLWLVVVSEPPGASEEKKRRQSAQLKMLSLTDVDRQTLEFSLADFKSQYLALIEEYNQEARQALASNSLPDLTGFLLRRSTLVQSTRDRLNLYLSKEGLSRVDAHVKAEKRHMKVAKKEGQ